MQSLKPSTQWSELTFAVIGLGLIGGSYAKALRCLGVKKILGFNRTRSVAQQAQNNGLIDIVLEDQDERLKEADALIMAVYPGAIIEFLRKNRQQLKENVLITDAAGIKKDLGKTVREVIGESMEFISGHPMAGRQGNGLELADEHLFDGANYIVVTEDENSNEAIEWLEAFAKAIGFAHTVRATPTEHDRIIAYTSDLTHITAVSLINSVSFNEKTRYFSAGSFRDATRVADINPSLWSELFMSNRDEVIEELDRYIDQLLLWRDALRHQDVQTMQSMMQIARDRKRNHSQ